MLVSDNLRTGVTANTRYETQQKVTLRGCTSSKGNKYAAGFELDDSGDYVNLKFVKYVKTKRNAD